MTAALTCSGLRVGYGDASVLTNIDLSIEAGSWMTLIGRNGIGKTTLLRAIAGLVAFEGEVRIRNGNSLVEITKLNMRQRALARACVSQRPSVPTGMTVGEYVMLGRAAHIPTFGVERRVDFDVVRDCLSRLSVESFSLRRVETLSGGEWQRVVLARALAQESPLLLLDEPTTSLDIGHQQEVLETIDGLRKSNGLTVLSTMHELTLAGQYADEVALLGSDGLVARGHPREVLTADLIREHYGANVEVSIAGDRVILTPVRLVGGVNSASDRT